MRKERKQQTALAQVLVLMVLAAMTCLSSCATQGLTREEKAAERQRVAAAVEQMVGDRQFTVEVNYVNPQRMPSRHLSYGYGVTVKGDTIDSYLPFFGEVRRAEYGSDQSGLRFTERIDHYQAVRTKKDCIAVEIWVRRHWETLVYRFDIFSNGRTSLMVRSDNRDTMMFNGDVAL